MNEGKEVAFGKKDILCGEMVKYGNVLEDFVDVEKRPLELETNITG